MRHHAGENLYRVRLLALGGEARLAGAAAIEIALDLFGRQRNQRRAAVDHAADRNPVAFAEGRDPEHVAEGVEGHFLDSRAARSRNVVTPPADRVKYGPALTIFGQAAIAEHVDRTLLDQEIGGALLRLKTQRH